jgi:hypothetical protein
MEKNIVTDLKIKAIQKGVTLTKLCALAGVNRCVLTHWSRKEPKSLETLRKLEQTLQNL